MRLVSTVVFSVVLGVTVFSSDLFAYPNHCERYAQLKSSLRNHLSETPADGDIADSAAKAEKVRFELLKHLVVDVLENQEKLSSLKGEQVDHVRREVAVLLNHFEQTGYSQEGAKLKTWTARYTIPLFRAAIGAVPKEKPFREISKDTRRWVSIVRDLYSDVPHLEVWEKAKDTTKQLIRWEIPEDFLNSISAARIEKKALTAAEEDLAYLEGLKRGSRKKSSQEPPPEREVRQWEFKDTQFSPDGSRLVFSLEASTDREERKHVFVLNLNQITNEYRSLPDGTTEEYLDVGSTALDLSGSLKSGKFSFSADNAKIVGLKDAEHGGDLIVWDTVDGRIEEIFPLPDAERVTSLKFANDGSSKLMTTHADGTVRAYELGFGIAGSCFREHNRFSNPKLQEKGIFFLSFYEAGKLYMVTEDGEKIESVFSVEEAFL